MRDPLTGAPSVAPEVQRAQNRVQAGRDTGVQDLNPAEDFSREAQNQRELVRGQVEGQNVLSLVRQQSAIDSATNPNVTGWSQPKQNVQAEIAKAIAASVKRRADQRNGAAIVQYPTLLKAAVSAANQGADINAEDIVRLVNYAEIDRAAQLYQNTTERGQKNILLTADPITRAAILDVVEARATDLLKDLETADDNQLVAALGTAASTILEPFVQLNEGSQQAFRAGLLSMDRGNPVQNYMSGVAAGSNPLGFLAAGLTNWNNVELDDFDDKYIETLKASGQYSPVAVDVMTAIAKATAAGDADPIFTAMDQFPDNAEADAILRSLIYRDAEDPSLTELGRQIDSANRGSSGQLYFTTFTTPDSSQFSEYRGTKGRETGAGAASVFYTFALDPTLYAAGAIKAYRVARYTLSKLAPGGGSARVALASKTVAGVETNAARKYWDRFTADLTKLDDLEAAGNTERVAAHRQLMERQYRELPTEVVEEFRKFKIRSTDDVAAFIDETNDIFLLSQGDPAAAALAGRGSILEEAPLFERLYGGGSTLTRDAMMPTMTSGRVLRQQAVAGINRVMPSARGEAVAKEFYGSGTTDEMVQALDAENAGLIGRADQAQGVFNGGLGRRLDGITRVFSSLPSKGVIYTGDARDARTFYKFARSFMTKRHADILTEGFRQGTVGQRRLMVAGVIRTAAGARGVNLSKVDVLEKIDDLATGSRIGELYSAGRTVQLSPPGTVPFDVDNTIVYRPSNFNGHEHALHAWQNANAVRIPSIRELEAIKAYRQMLPDMVQNAPQNITDAWSFGTLFGPRFAIRSAIEDIWAYFASAGNLPLLFSSRRASTALRDANPTVTIKTHEVMRNGRKVHEPHLDKDGNVQLIVNSRLGMIAKRARKAGDKFDGSDSSVGKLMQMFFLSNMDGETVFKAQEAAKAGNWQPMRELISESAGRLRLSGLDDQAIRDLQDLASTGFGLKQLDEIAEVAKFTQSGMYPTLVDNSVAGAAVQTVEIAPDAKTAFGDFIPIKEGADNPYYTLFWFRNIEGVIEHDGVIGKLAVAHLENRQKAIDLVADAIRNDTTFDYKNQFSALYTGAATVDEFAQRYVDDVYTMFSGKDGVLNKRLLDRVAPRDASTGPRGGGRVVSLTDEDGTARVTPGTLRSFREDGAPEYVLGREGIPMPQDDSSFFDKGWGWMGEQYARIAREPVFLANYREQRNLLRSYEESLASKIGDDAARQRVAHMASDRAYGFTLNYVDNPTNRSQMAWKMRNVSRYYRATEDFYRRTWRMAKTYPEGFWKTALTYQVLSDTGFVFTDDNGDKYFAYPGNEILQSVVTGIIQPLTSTQNLDIDPFFLGGKVKMLAPSSDPNQAFATVMGPLAVMSASFIFDKFPEIAGLERYVVGEYGVDAEWYDTLIPSSVGRALRMMNKDERDSMYGSAVMDAFAIAVANDLIPDVDAEGNPITQPGQIRQLPEWEAIQRIAWGNVITRGMMGYFVPASPQVYDDNVTEYGRAHGIDSLRDGFLDLVSKNQGDVGKAMVDWWRLNPKGDLMPFTVSTSEATEDIKNLAKPLPVQPLARWYADNKDLVKRFPSAALFLAPREGEFSWKSYSVIAATMGLKQGKDFDTFMVDVKNADLVQMYYSTYDDYQADIDQLNPADPAQAEQIKLLSEQRKADLDWMKDNNPSLGTALSQDQNWALQDTYASSAFNDTKTMVNTLWDEGKNTPASDAIMSVIATYEDYATDIKSITGSTNAEDTQKRQWRAQLEADLAGIGNGDPNAEVFIDRVLKRYARSEGVLS
jgi:hypothetical protein